MIFAVALVAFGALAQTSEEGLIARIPAVRYPPLGEYARLAGDVRIKIRSGMVSLRSGHPLLAQTAMKSAETMIGSIQDTTGLDVTYHFVLVDAATSTHLTKVPRGNAFERAVLRALGLKTEKLIVEYSCQERVPPKNEVKIADGSLEIWIYSRARCLQTETVTLMAKR